MTILSLRLRALRTTSVNSTLLARAQRCSTHPLLVHSTHLILDNDTGRIVGHQQQIIIKQRAYVRMVDVIDVAFKVL